MPLLGRASVEHDRPRQVLVHANALAMQHAVQVGCAWVILRNGASAPLRGLHAVYRRAAIVQERRERELRVGGTCLGGGPGGCQHGVA